MIEYYNVEGLVIGSVFDEEPTFQSYIKHAMVDGVQVDNPGFDAPACAETLRKEKMTRVDSHTKNEIAKGFIFDGHTFSLSTEAQANWTGVQAAITAGFLTEADFPFEASTTDGGIYELNWTDRAHFIGTVFQTINSHMSTGRKAKKIITEASTIGEIVAAKTD